VFGPYPVWEKVSMAGVLGSARLSTAVDDADNIQLNVGAEELRCLASSLESSKSSKRAQRLSGLNHTQEKLPRAGGAELRCLAQSLEAKLAQRIPDSARANWESGLPVSPTGVDMGSLSEGPTATITMQAIMELLDILEVDEEQRTFYATWAEVVALGATQGEGSTTPGAAITRLSVSCEGDMIEHHVCGPTDCMLRLCTQWVRCCRLPVQGLSHLYNVQNFVQAPQMSLWCRVRSPGSAANGDVFDAGYVLEGPMPWRIVNRLMPFEGEFAVCRDFLSYSQQEFRCTSYRGSLLPEQPEFAFAFSPEAPDAAAQGEDDSSGGLQSGSSAASSLHGPERQRRPLLASFAFFRRLLFPDSESTNASGTVSGARGTTDSSEGSNTRRSLPYSAGLEHGGSSGSSGQPLMSHRALYSARSGVPDSVDRLKSLTDLAGRLSDDDRDPFALVVPRLEDTSKSAGLGVFATSDRKQQELLIEEMAQRCRITDGLRLVIHGIAEGMTRTSLQLNLQPENGRGVPAAELIKKISGSAPPLASSAPRRGGAAAGAGGPATSGNSPLERRLDRIHRVIRSRVVSSVEAEANTESEAISLAFGYHSIITAGSFVPHGFKRLGGTPAPAIIGDL